jgi:Right handed beta helix region
VFIDSCVTYKTGQIGSIQEKNGISVVGETNQAEEGWNSHITISRNRVSYSGVVPFVNTGSRAAEGISTTSQQNVLIADNDISHVDVAIELNNQSSGVTLHDYRVSGNMIHDLTESATYGGYGLSNPTAGALSRFAEMTVSNNTIVNAYTSGLAVQRVDDLTVTGNIVRATNLVAAANADRAVTILGVHGGVIMGNRIEFSFPMPSVIGIVVQGIVGSDTSTDVCVVSNTIVDVPAVGAESIGILVSGGASSTVIESNVIVGGDYGIAVHSYGDNVGNYIVDNLVLETRFADIVDRSGQTNTILRWSASRTNVPLLACSDGPQALSLLQCY